MKHPLAQFLYCPRCGAKAFVEANEKAKKCTLCHFVYYFNPSSAVACIISDKDENILVVKRAKDPAKGTLDLPGGFSDMFETAEETVRREVKEETGLELTSLRYLFSVPNIYLYSGFEVHTVDLIYKGEVDSLVGAVAQDDAAEICIIPQKELDPEAFGLTSIRQVIRRICTLDE
ncbi:MAG: NUDIX domain-containing protein [Massilibacteroides sp.]|nr:NUDIX domain-containing protein [Massilibacteroides sp.]MDD3062570.1 NUDIX domain-containing protein [Massilibacteroides sp.]MDD4115543.1 NUDIX domain-containing protein [Massilibacteroides sp.]MDD4659338.1 NUDIX domain-containing protein [Massilibacteroides sp.]